jgi:hypothetical protein
MLSEKHAWDKLWDNTGVVVDDSLGLADRRKTGLWMSGGHSPTARRDPLVIP